MTTLDGARSGIGDLLQRARGSTVSSELKLSFFDGSVDDETTIFSQRGVFRFISDHHIQRGPSFPKPMDATVDVSRGMVTVTDEGGQIKQIYFDMPPDVYNGLAATMLMNVSPPSPETRISIVLASAKPRIIHLSMKNAGEATFTLGGVSRQAIDFVVHVQLGGIAGVLAPVIGKQPLDYHVWIGGGQEDPVFIREEGQLYEGGPTWRIQQISAAFP